MKGGLGRMKNIGNDPRSLFNGNHFSSYLYIFHADPRTGGANPTLGCSIEISRYYIYYL